MRGKINGYGGTALSCPAPLPLFLSTLPANLCPPFFYFFVFSLFFNCDSSFDRTTVNSEWRTANCEIIPPPPPPTPRPSPLRPISFHVPLLLKPQELVWIYLSPFWSFLPFVVCRLSPTRRSFLSSGPFTLMFSESPRPPSEVASILRKDMKLQGSND